MSDEVDPRADHRIGVRSRTVRNSGGVHLASGDLLIVDSGFDHVPFEGGGMREANGDRPRFELLFPLDVPYEQQMLTRFAVHMAKGAKKYADRNWENFSDHDALEHCKASALRHIVQWLCGTDDGEDHAAAVMFNLMAAENITGKFARKSQ